jgi:drug/metabolite transporter (DMT)-like permease
MPHEPGRPGAIHFAVLGALGTIWGSSFLFMSVALASLPPLTIAALRIGISFAFLLAIVLLLGHRLPRDGDSWRKLVAMGLLSGSVPFTLLVFGQQRIDSSVVAMLITTVPLFTLGLAHACGDDRADLRKLAGVAIGFLGVVLLLGPAALQGEASSLLGQLLVMGAAFAFALTQIIGRRLSPAAGSAFMRATFGTGVSALVSVPLALLIEAPWTLAAPRADSILAVLALGLVSTALGHVLFYWLIARMGPNFVAANNYLAPAVGVLWGVALLGEALTWLRCAALAVIFLGVAIATSARLRPSPAGAAP